MSEKIIRFKINNEVKTGKVIENRVVSGSLEKKIEDVEVLPPSQPSKIICVGLNYKRHAEELNQETPDSPVFFYKPPSSVIGHRDKIKVPNTPNRVDYEAEMAVVVGKKCRNIKKEEVNDHLLGYTCLNDVTARDIQDKEKQWVISKGFDTFCPIGPWISRDIPRDAEIKCLLNNEVKQSSSLNNLIFDEKELVSKLSEAMTLNRGDIISTGTPQGVGEIKEGDKIEIKIEGIGSLINGVARA